MEFEQGPIRPPSEARSLLIRVNRNCPWNHCTFCPVYKRRKFERRSTEDVLEDIRSMGACAERVRERSRQLGCDGEVNRLVASDILNDPSASQGTKTLAMWLYGGGHTVFLQDANAVFNRQPLLLSVLAEIAQQFPQVDRITSYARAHTLARKTVEQLTELRAAGLGRIHMGLETGHDPLLKYIRKGTTTEECITAGRQVRDAGIHLCFYVMPGLGGHAMSDGHADDTARVCREVDPDRIRLRSLVVHPRTPLGEAAASGEFEPLDDEETVAEIGRFLAGLEGCTGDLVSDHDLNLLMELEGHLETDRDRLLAIIRRFQEMSERDRLRFIVARRAGAAHAMDDLNDPQRRAQVDRLLATIEEATGERSVGAAIQALRERMV